MKKILMGLAFTFTAVSFASAQDVATQNSTINRTEILVCSFTEPFFTITYNASTKEITYTGVDMYDELNNEFMVLTLATQAQFVALPQTDVNGQEYIYPTNGSQFQLLDDSGNMVVELTLSYLGSDGMSDFIYPFDAVHSSGHVGGCYSTSAPLIDATEIYENLK